MKISKKNIVCFHFLILGLFSLKAQNATTTTGGDATGANGSASYSIGQVVYTDVTSPSGSSNQGVQQPYLISIIGGNTITEWSFINLEVSVYPNPSSSLIYLNIGNLEFKKISYQLLDGLGQTLRNQIISNSQTQIPINEFASGIYYLKVYDNNSELKAFKIIKN